MITIYGGADGHQFVEVRDGENPRRVVLQGRLRRCETRRYQNGSLMITTEII